MKICNLKSLLYGSTWLVREELSVPALNLIMYKLIDFLCSCVLQDIAQEAVKKRRRATKKPYSRSIVGATLEVIQKKRTEKPEVRDAAREAALRYVLI